MFSSTKMLVSNLFRVQLHVNDKQPACRPTPMWWIFLHIIHAFTEKARASFVSLQSPTRLTSKKWQQLSGLIDIYCRMSGMQGLLGTHRIAGFGESSESSGRSTFSYADSRFAIDSFGMHFIEVLDAMPAEYFSKTFTVLVKILDDAAATTDEIF